MSDRAIQSRRAVIAGLAALPAAPVAAETSSSSTATIERLIEAHRAAAKAKAEAGRAWEEAYRAWRKLNPPESGGVPCIASGGGFSAHDLDEARDAIRAHYAKVRAWISKPGAFFIPLAEMIAALDAMERVNHEVAATAVEEHNRRREAFDLPALEEQHQVAAEAEEEALTDLSSYRCETVEEIRLRAAYVNSAFGYLDACGVALGVLRSSLP